MAKNQITTSIGFLTTICCLLLLFTWKGSLPRQRSKEYILQEVKRLCLSSEVIPNRDLRWSCKYFEEARQTILFLPDQIELENLEKLKFATSPLPCKNKDLLVLVNSGAHNKEKRRAIRETWKPELERVGKVSVYFVTGMNMDDSVMKENLEEAEKNGDLIILELLDEYRRISIKHIMMYKWMRENCLSAKYLIKCDDDIMVDPFRYEFLEKEFMGNQTMEIYGQLLGGRGVIRGGEKWNLPSAFYPLPTYPDYLNGPAVIQSKSATMKLLELLRILPIFGIDDVWIGGFAAALAGVTPVSHRSMNGPNPLVGDNWQKSVFSWVAGSAEDIRANWKNLSKHYPL